MEILELRLVVSVPSMYLYLTAGGLFKTNGDPGPTLFSALQVPNTIPGNR